MFYMYQMRLHTHIANTLLTHNCILKEMYYIFIVLYLVSKISSISPFRNERKPSDSAVQSNNAALVDPEN